eukprot:TRINITY_DN3477_c0_g1_i3.p1 TRINITY_DN3477_c0_g1~~TRINITY_DN3477_c0_g1_i3.p1  ORF type:complete len:482 (+),score=80.89 TRINITY_DN3477_c0_g1_i3:66-1511(+)
MSILAKRLEETGVKSFRSKICEMKSIIEACSDSVFAKVSAQSASCQSNRDIRTFCMKLLRELGTFCASEYVIGFGIVHLIMKEIATLAVDDMENELEVIQKDFKEDSITIIRKEEKFLESILIFMNASTFQAIKNVDISLKRDLKKRFDKLLETFKYIDFGEKFRRIYEAAYHNDTHGIIDQMNNQTDLTRIGMKVLLKQVEDLYEINRFLDMVVSQATPDYLRVLLEDAPKDYFERNEGIVFLATELNKPDMLSVLLEFCPISEREKSRGSRKLNPLHFAARAGFLKCMKLLVEGMPKSYLETKDNTGSTPLFGASVNGHPKCCEFLIKSADVNYREITNNIYSTALHKALLCNRIECIRVLLEGSNSEYREMKLPDVEVDSFELGYTLLHATALYNRVEATKLLLEGSRPEFREMVDENGSTPLHIAAAEDHFEIIELLLEDSPVEYREMRENVSCGLIILNILLYCKRSNFPISLLIP